MSELQNFRGVGSGFSSDNVPAIDRSRPFNLGHEPA